MVLLLTEKASFRVPASLQRKEVQNWWQELNSRSKAVLLLGVPAFLIESLIPYIFNARVLSIECKMVAIISTASQAVQRIHELIPYQCHRLYCGIRHLLNLTSIRKPLHIKLDYQIYPFLLSPFDEG